MISPVSHLNPQMVQGIPKTTSSTTFLTDLNLHQNLSTYASEGSAFSEDSASEPTTSDNSDSSDYEDVDVDADDDDGEEPTVRSAPPLVGIGIVAPRTRPRALHRTDSEESSSDEDYVAIEAEQGDDFDDEEPVRSISWAPSTTQRSAASRRLFATLSREDKVTTTTTSNDLCSRRGHRRLPSLDQIRTRVSGLGIRDTNPSPKLHGSPAPRILVQASPTPSPRTPKSSSRHLNAGSVGHHKRSVSCPSPKPEQVWQVNEDMTITVTPPTPTPQARSPIMGYILQNAGHPVHPIRFRRHRDDVDLLHPPCFELAPGRQQMVEARARQAMEQMAALHAVAKDQHRIIGPGNGALVGLGWPAGGAGAPPQSAPAPLSSRPIRATIRGGGGAGGVRRERGIAANMPKSQSLSSLSDDWRQRATTTVPLPPRAASPPRVAAVAKYIPPCRRQGPAYQPPSPPASKANVSFALPARPSSPPSSSSSSATPTSSQSARAVAGRHLLSRLSERGGAGRV